jgi:group II intron reverse transcriptase/maturase
MDRRDHVINGTRPLPIKHHSLTGRITLPWMYEAFQAVKKNRGAAGVDRVSIQRFESNLEQNLVALMRDLKGRTFRPQPARRTYIEKGGGKKRPLGIPCVRDRVAQEVLRRLLTPLFEPLFHSHSYGFRPGRSCHDALREVDRLHRLGYRFTLDADISGFFDNIPHQVIMKGLRNVVADGNILNLVEGFLTAGVMEDGIIYPTTVGTPQGGVLSPLLANIALNFLDWQLDAEGYTFVRYADDFVVLCPSKRQAEEARRFVETAVSDLGLALSPEKTVVTSFKGGFSFLGFDITHRARRMRTKSVEKYKARIRELTVRCHNLDAQAVAKINAVIRGVARYFATEFSTVTRQFRYLDHWTRLRLRCMKLKRIRKSDNYKLRNKHLRRIGLIWLSDFLAPSHGCPRGSSKEAILLGSPGARKTHAGK